MLPSDQLHLTNAGITHLLNNLGLSEMAESKLGNRPTNRWQHEQGISKTLSQTQRRASTKPISTLPQQRHLTHPTSLRYQQHWSRNAHQTSTQHALPPPPSPPPRHHTSSPHSSIATYTIKLHWKAAWTGWWWQTMDSNSKAKTPSKIQRRKLCSQQFLIIC